MRNLDHHTSRRADRRSPRRPTLVLWATVLAQLLTLSSSGVFEEKPHAYAQSAPVAGTEPTPGDRLGYELTLEPIGSASDRRVPIQTGMVLLDDDDSGVRFHFTSEHDQKLQLYLFAEYDDGRVERLFPHASIAVSNPIPAGQEIHLPSSNASYELTPVVGSSTIRSIVTIVSKSQPAALLHFLDVPASGLEGHRAAQQLRDPELRTNADWREIWLVPSDL